MEYFTEYLAHEPTDCTRPFFPHPQKMAWVQGYASPGSNKSRRPLCRVISLSLLELPNRSEMKVMTPVGLIATRPVCDGVYNVNIHRQRRMYYFSAVNNNTRGRIFSFKMSRYMSLNNCMCNQWSKLLVEKY